MAFGKQFAEIAERLPGLVALGLVAADGLLVEKHGLVEKQSGGNLDFEALGAEVVAQAQGLSDERRGLDLGELRQWTLVTDRFVVLLNRLDKESLLVAVLEPDAPLGRARYELRRARLLFEDVLA
jgi:predicted regulator of Ras-like GTPase activity (Roadblock/LC7/MglB family)